MDIVTHSLIGVASASGIMHSHPMLACGVIAGNVLPDLDAFSRLGGKHAFLQFHQTYSHSLAAIVFPVVIAAWLSLIGQSIWASMALGTAIGMAMHVGLDLTNSYGVRCFWPLSTKRFALDWIFFIDAPILALTIVALLVAAVFRQQPQTLKIVSLAYGLCMAGGIAARACIATRVRNRFVQSIPSEPRAAVIPTTFWPVKFLVCRYEKGKVITSIINAINGEETDQQCFTILDAELPESLLQLREWRVMRGYSPYYHAVDRTANGDAERFICRDLRIRNFGTRFGMLTCRVDSSGAIESKRWEV